MSDSNYRAFGLGTTGVVAYVGATRLRQLVISNNAGSVRYVKVYDKATAATEADTPILTIMVPASRTIPVPMDAAVVNGISLRATTGAADNDTGAPGTNEVTVRVGSRQSPLQPTVAITTTTTAAPAYDYLITNDATWTSVFANSDATLAGKTIAVAAGNYTAKTLSNRNPSSPIRIKALEAISKPVINTLTLSASNKLIFEDLQIQTTAWNSTPKGCVDFSGACDSITFTRCNIWGNYRGTVNPTFDLTTDNQPEYACILPQFNADGTLASLIRQRDYVGDLLTNGTYSITFTALSGYSFSVTPQATFTVSGGFITSTNITNAGAGTHTDVLNGNIGGLSKICSWAGQNRMIDYTVFGMRGNTSPNISNITVQDCNFDFLGNAFKPSGFSGAVTLVGNTFTRIYQDYISVGCGQNNFPMTITDNYGTLPFSKTGDPGDPHSDFLQFFMNDINVPYTPQDWSDVTLERNFFADGNARGGVQGAIIADAPENIAFNRWRIVGNHIASKILALGLNIVTPRDCYIVNNNFIFYDPSDPQNTNARYITVSRTLDSPQPPGPFAFGTTLIKDNITEILNRGVADNIVIADVGNVILGLNGATIPYTSVFSNPNGTRDTLATGITAYAPTGGYSGKGAFGNQSYISHATRTTNRSLEPSYVVWAQLTGQTVSTQVTSSWSCLISGQNGRAISIANGEYRVADDANGTNATSWTSSSGTINVGKFIQVRHTTSANGSTQTTSTVTIGSDSFTFVSTTASTASFTTVDNGGTAYSAMARPAANETNLKKLIMVVRFRIDSITTNANVMAHTAAGVVGRLWFPSGTAIRGQFLSSTRANLRPTFTPAVGQFRTHYITIDLSNTNANQGCYWATDVEGVILNNTPGSGGVFDTRSTAGSGTDYGAAVFDLTSAANSVFSSTGSLGLFAEADGGGVPFDGAMDFFWMDWGGSGYTLPDITDAAVRNKWSADLIGANGNGPTGSQPKIYYTGNAAGWNAGLSNLGSLALTLTKGAGTYS